MKDILQADAIFLTGTAAEVQLVGKINKKKFNLNNSIFELIKKNYNSIKLKSPKSVNKS